MEPYFQHSMSLFVLLLMFKCLWKNNLKIGIAGTDYTYIFVHPSVHSAVFNKSRKLFFEVIEASDNNFDVG